MRLRIEEVGITKIDRREASELIAELNKLNLPFTSEYPRLYELKKLLSNSFESSFPDIHRIVRDGER